MKLEKSDQPKVGRSSSEILMDYADKGYLFHGSNNGNLCILNPKIPMGVHGDSEFENNEAVYAADNPAISIAFSLAFPDNIERKGHLTVIFGDNGVFSKMPLSWKSQIKKTKGYIYVVDNNDFEVETPGLKNVQCKSKKNVEPVDIVEVTLGDYSKLGGKIEWTE